MFEVAKRLKSETNAHKPSSVDAERRKDSRDHAILRYAKQGTNEGETELLERN